MGKDGEKGVNWSEVLPPGRLEEAKKLSERLRVVPIVYVANVPGDAIVDMLAGVGGDDDEVTVRRFDEVFAPFELGLIEVLPDINGDVVTEDAGILSVAVRMAATRCHDGLMNDVNAARAETLFNRGIVSEEASSRLKRWYDTWDWSEMKEYKDKQFLGIALDQTTLVLAGSDKDKRFATHVRLPQVG